MRRRSSDLPFVEGGTVDLIQQYLIDPVSGFLWTSVLVYVLIGVGLYFGVRTRFVQVRMFGRMVSQVASSRGGSEGGISSFQAFCLGLASRVGTATSPASRSP